MTKKIDGMCRVAVRVIVAAVALGCVSTQAADKEGTYQWGPISLYPTLEARFTYESNYLKQERNPQSSFITVISPDLGLSIASELEYGTEWGFKAGAEWAGYESNPNDSYVNLRALLDASSEPTDYIGLYGGLGWQLGHEPRGSDHTQGYEALFYSEPLEYEEWQVIGRADYDFTSRDRFGLEARYEDRNYRNFRELTRASDYNAMRYLLSAHHQLEPNSSLLASVSLNDYDYPYSDLDSRQWEYLLGMEWDITYQTKGHASVGWSEKDMLERDTNTGSMFSWDVGVDWAPLTYSRFSLGAHGGFEETDSAGDFKEVRGVEANWSHHWTSYIASNLGVSYDNEKYVNYYAQIPTNGTSYWDRDDDIWEFHAGLEYQARRWLTLAAGYRHEDRSSNVPGYSYDNDVIELIVRVGLFDAIGDWPTGGNL